MSYPIIHSKMVATNGYQFRLYSFFFNLCVILRKKEVLMKKSLYYSLIISLFVGLAACAESSPTTTPTPKWTNNQYTLTFETGGGTQIEAINVALGENILLPQPTRTDYDFAGWYLNGEIIDSSFIFLFESDITLEARWEYSLIEVHLELIREPVQISNWRDNRLSVLDNYESLHLFKTTFGAENFYVYDDLILDIPNYLDIDEEVSSIDLTNGNIVVLSSKGRVLTFGSNFYGQLGNGTFLDDFSDFSDITTAFNFEEGEFPIKVSVYGTKAGLLTSNGRIFLWGSTTFEVLDQQYYSTIPMDVTGYFTFDHHDERVVDFFLATEKLFITNYNTIFGWGNPGGGGLGTGGLHAGGRVPINFSKIYTSLEFDINDQIIRSNVIKDGGSILTADNRLIVWGNNSSKKIYDILVKHVTPIEINVSEIFNLSEDEVLVDIIEDYDRYYFVTSLGRVFLTGLGLVNPPGPNLYTIHSIQNPLELSFVLNVNDRLLNCCGDLTLYINGSFKATLHSFNNEEINWHEINLPNKLLTTTINKNEALDVFEIFNIDSNHYEIISNEESLNQTTFILRRILPTTKLLPGT